MADPQQSLSLGEWFAAIVACILAGIGGAMTWFNGEKKMLRGKMHTLENSMVAWNLAQSEQRQKHAVLEQRHENIEGKLGDIKEYCERLDSKMDALRDLVKTKT